MIDEMRARFGPRFIETARGRIRRSLELLGKPNETEQLITELHSLAGESAMLGLQKISDTARSGEKYAKEWAKGATTAKLYCARSVRSLSQQLEEFAASVEGGQGGKSADDSSPSGSESGASGSPSGRRRILVIDDSRLAGDHLCEALEENDIAARLAMTRESALTELAEFVPELIVCDVHMPGIDLDELCRALRSAAPQPISIELLSGMSEPELSRRAREVQADGYVSKHAGIDGVVSHLRAALAELSD